MWTLPADAQIENATALLAQLDDALGRAGGEFAVDAGALREFDTSTLSLLLQAQRLTARRGGALVVHNAPSKLRELARLYGVDELLPWGPERPSAGVAGGVA
jgi:phospholipid transport system transporter-binding protein